MRSRQSPENRRGTGLRAGALAVTLGLSLAGCATITGEVTPRIYDLRAPSSIDVGGRSSSRQILVAEPSAVRFYATDRIVVRDTSSTLAYYPSALWSDALPDLFQARLAETLERTGRVRAVGRPGQGLLIDTRLVPEIRAFEVTIAGTSAVATVDVTLKIMNDSNGRILATQTFTANVPASSDGTEDGVAALNTALEQVLTQMAVFVLDTV